MIAQGQQTIPPLPFLAPVGKDVPMGVFHKWVAASMAGNLGIFIAALQYGTGYIAGQVGKGKVEVEDNSISDGSIDDNDIDAGTGNGTESNTSSDSITQSVTAVNAELSLLDTLLQRFKPSPLSNYVFYMSLLQVALVPAVHHLGQPMVPNLGALPGLQVPILAVLGVVALLSNGVLGQSSLLHKWLELAPMGKGEAVMTSMVVGIAYVAVMQWDGFIRRRMKADIS